MKTGENILPFVTVKVFRPQNEITKEDREAFNQVYSLWSMVWRQVIEQEMGLNSPLYSNDFTRQQHILSLFISGKCIGTVFMREVDFNLLSAADDSYFRFWPKDILDNLARQYQRSIVVSNFTVSPEFRNSKHFEWKTLLMCLFIDYFKLLDIPVMISAARRIKSNEKLCYQLGAKCILQNIPYKTESLKIISESEAADLLYWRPDVDLSLSHYELQIIRERLLKTLRENIYESKAA